MTKRQPRAVVGIFTHTPEPNKEEIRSLVQCSRILQSHPICLIHPEGMDTAVYLKEAPNLKLAPIPEHHLASLRSYNRLKVTPWLYEQFKEYDFFLTYELDAWVFRDELIDWCEKDFDYIGAPWFVGHYRGKADAAYLGVGNSGFSLRKIPSVLKVFQSSERLLPFTEATQQWWNNGRFSLKYTWWWLERLTNKNRFRHGKHDFPDNEDVFWGELVPKRLPWFRVAPVESAKAFAFELYPERMYQELGRLPFGCHKYLKNNPEFWRLHMGELAGQ